MIDVCLICRPQNPKINGQNVFNKSFYPHPKQAQTRKITENMILPRRKLKEGEWKAQKLFSCMTYWIFYVNLM